MHIWLFQNNSQKSHVVKCFFLLKASFFLEGALCSFTYMRFQQVFKLDSQLLAGDFEEQSPNKERKH